MTGIITGIGWHMVGAASAASFYAPISKVKRWTWESTWAVAGIRMPARERRSPSLCEIWTMTRSKSTEIGCLSSSTARVSDLALADPFFVVDVGT